MKHAVRLSALAAILLVSREDADAGGISTLKMDADCMLHSLKRVPGVTAAKLGYSADGLPYLEYSGAERNRWVQPTHFSPEKNFGYQFIADMPGLASKADDTLDMHVTDEVLRRWKIECGVNANVLLE